jgi:2-polyprenyl-6-methoxyphenol hydroxylase-like FAD-dependent oxidoreductase
VEHLPVLVVGAGPVGLATAVVLDHLGVRCRVVDRAPAPRSTPGAGITGAPPAGVAGAGAVEARTLELLAQLHLAEPFLDHGVPVRAAAVQWRGRVLTEVDHATLAPDSPFPFVLGIPDSTTAAILEHRLETRGIGVERGVTFVACTQDADSVTSTLRHADGSTETVHSRWLAGCDGPRSRVRDACGIAFDGADPPTGYALGDVELTWDESPDRALLLLDDRGGIRLSPLGADRWHLAADLGPTRATRRATRPTRAQLQRLCDEHLPQPARIRAVHGSGSLCVDHGRARTLRAGRAFLLGDAAAARGPLTFRATNAGIQDAWDLGWRLAAAERGAATETLLDSYDSERRGVDERLTADPGEIEGVLGVAASVRRAALEPALPFLASLPGFQRAMARARGHAEYAYRGSAAVAGAAHDRPAPGDLAPEEPRATAGGVALHDGRSYVSILFVRTQEELRTFARPTWPTDGSVPVRTVVVSRRPARGGVPGTAVVDDPEGTLRRAWGVTRPTHVLVRPDGTIGWRGRPDAGAGLAAYWQRLHGTRLPIVAPAPPARAAARVESESARRAG